MPNFKPISEPDKTVMVIGPAKGKCPDAFSIHLLCALYVLIGEGYKIFIYGDLGAVEQLFLSMLAQIRNTYPDKTITVIRVEPRQDLYHTQYAGKEYCPDFIHFIERESANGNAKNVYRRGPVERFLVRNSGAILSCGNPLGRREAQALKTAFPFKIDYKALYRQDLRLAPVSHKRLRVQVYEK